MNKNIEDNILNLVIGEDIPTDAPKEFRMIKLYIRDNEDNLNLYADIALPHLMNYSEFLDIKNDPRYYFKENFEPETRCCKSIYELKPLGEKKGVYTIFNGLSIKMVEIEPLYEIKNNVKVYTLTKKNN